MKFLTSNIAFLSFYLVLLILRYLNNQNLINFSKQSFYLRLLDMSLITANLALGASVVGNLPSHIQHALME